MSTKILYLSHIDWRYIKQRPQFIAECLSKNTEVLYISGRSVKRLFGSTPKDHTKLRILYYPSLPLIGLGSTKIALLLLNNLFCLIRIFLLLTRNKPQAIYTTSPIHYYTIKVLTTLLHAHVFYDCMDDNIGIKDIYLRNYTIKLEKKLLKIASSVFVSSNRLSTVARKRGAKKLPIVVNNGIDRHLLRYIKNEDNVAKQNGSTTRLLYFGSIDYWFDFASIEKLLNKKRHVTMTLLGPLKVRLPKHPRLNYLGIAPHEELRLIAQDYDILTMPFVVSDLIRSVDPVKIYEYISFYKNIVCVYYDEMNRFKDFIKTYRNYEEFEKCVDYFINNKNPIYSRQHAFRFLSLQTWESRSKQVFNEMSKYIA